MNVTTDAVSGAPLVSLPAGALPTIHRLLARDRSPEEAATLARELGYDAGEGFLDAFAAWLRERGEERAPAALPADLFWPLLAGFFASLGWGPLELELPHPGVASLSSVEWAEAEREGGAGGPTCHLTTGLLADLLGRVAGADLAVMEVECRSRGDERCRFVLGGAEALEVLYERLVAGDTYREALGALG